MAKGVDVVRLEEDQIEAAVEMLARFVDGQPQADTFGGDREQRLNQFRRGFSPLVRYCSAHGHPLGAVEAGRLVGLALWMPPYGSRATPEEEVEFGLDQMPAIFGDPVSRMRPLGDLLRDLHKRDMKVPHWFLAMLVVDPSRQGSGVGSGLVRPILLRADEGNLQCYADTILPEYVPFYNRHGFKVLEEGIEPTVGMRYWTMRRDPMPA